MFNNNFFNYIGHKSILIKNLKLKFLVFSILSVMLLIPDVPRTIEKQIEKENLDTQAIILQNKPQQIDCQVEQLDE